MIRPRCASVNPIEFVRMLPDLRWPKPNFKTAALNHSATFHGRNFNHLTDLLLLPKPKIGAGLAPARPFSFLFHSEAPPTALSAAFPASVISYRMSCMLGGCDERLM